MEENKQRNYVNFFACLTSLFNNIVSDIEENAEILICLCGKDGIVYAICDVHEKFDLRSSCIEQVHVVHKVGSVII
jgi:conserved oligomeric Golgi complex subunit 4